MQNKILYLLYNFLGRQRKGFNKVARGQADMWGEIFEKTVLAAESGICAAAEALPLATAHFATISPLSSETGFELGDKGKQFFGSHVGAAEKTWHAKPVQDEQRARFVGDNLHMLGNTQLEIANCGL